MGMRSCALVEIVSNLFFVRVILNNHVWAAIYSPEMEIAKAFLVVASVRLLLSLAAS